MSPCSGGIPVVSVLLHALIGYDFSTLTHASSNKTLKIRTKTTLNLKIFWHAGFHKDFRHAGFHKDFSPANVITAPPIFNKYPKLQHRK